MSGVSIWCCLWTWPSWVVCAPEWSPEESISAWARQNSNQDMLTVGVMTIMNAFLRINALSYVLLLPPYNLSILLKRYQAHNWEVLLPSGHSFSLLCWCLTAMAAILVFGGRIWFVAAYQQHTKHHRILSTRKHRIVKLPRLKPYTRRHTLSAPWLPKLPRRVLDHFGNLSVSWFQIRNLNCSGKMLMI